MNLFRKFIGTKNVFWLSYPMINAAWKKWGQQDMNLLEWLESSLLDVQAVRWY